MDNYDTWLDDAWLYDAWLDALYQNTEPEIKCPCCGSTSWDFLLGHEQNQIIGCSDCIKSYTYDEMREYEADQYTTSREDEYRE